MASRSSAPPDILSRCMRKKGVDDDTAAQLLSGLPETFDQWKTNQSSARAVQGAADGEFERADPPDPADVMDLLVGPTGLRGMTWSSGGPIGPFGPTGPAAG
jgi:hypothetical protein